MLPYQSLIAIDLDNKRPQYQQIVDQILSCIKNGNLQPGSKLPSSRVLATMLKVHRKTVIAAYDELINQGWIVPKARSGYFINSEIEIPEQSGNDKATELFPDKLPVLINTKYVADKMQVSSLSDIPNSYIDDGLPDARIAPFSNLIREFKALCQREYKLKKVNAGSMADSTRLREALISHLSKSRGFLPKIDNVLVTSGAQMAIYLVGQALINPGDIVIVGFPGYGLANYSFQNCSAKVVDVPVDNDGINTDEIELVCKKHTVKAIYVVPHHHYPTTATLSPQRRLKLIKMAATYNFLIIEDDYDFDYHYSSAPHLPMATYPHEGRVVYISSLSKSFAASMRLGFIVASSDLISAMGSVRKNIDIRGDLLMEESVAALFENGEMERHLRRSVNVYKERRDFLCSELDKNLKHAVSYIKPAGGLAIWLKIADQYRVEVLVDGIKKEGFSFNPKAVFGAEYNLNHLRLGFASLNHQEIVDLVQAMNSALKKYNIIKIIKD